MFAFQITITVRKMTVDSLSAVIFCKEKRYYHGNDLYQTPQASGQSDGPAKSERPL